MVFTTTRFKFEGLNQRIPNSGTRVGDSAHTRYKLKPGKACEKDPKDQHQLHEWPNTHELTCIEQSESRECHCR